MGNNDDRYQFQPWYVRSYRWWKWMPLYSVAYCWHMAKWMVSGMKPADDFSRRATASMIWSCCKGSAQERMKFYWSQDEVRDWIDRRMASDGQ